MSWNNQIRARLHCDIIVAVPGALASYVSQILKGNNIEPNGHMRAKNTQRHSDFIYPTKPPTHFHPDLENEIDGRRETRRSP